MRAAALVSRWTVTVEGCIMPTLIPEFARALAESNRRAATAVDEEVRQAEALRDRALALRDLRSAWDQLRRRVARVAREATRAVGAEAGEVRDLWSDTIASLRAGLPGDEQLAVLRAVEDL